MARFGWRLRDFATNWVGNHPIVDATGLEGGWNFTLSFSPPWATQVNPDAELADPDGKLSIFEALDKELGLKLETKKSPMQVLVIDRIEQQPTEN
jgi:uncharacterized protein (TIGR03435 family)